jgi:hypothetical protein
MGERVTAFLAENGMIEGRLTTALWRRSGLLGPARTEEGAQA